jgi:hypothetical protein
LLCPDFILLLTSRICWLMFVFNKSSGLIKLANFY